MNEVTQTLSGLEQQVNFDLLYAATKTWEPELVPLPKHTWTDCLIWRMQSWPVEIKGHPSEFVGVMRITYDEMKQAIMDGVKLEGHDKSYDIYGWQVQPHMDTDLTTNLYNPSICNLRVRLFLIKKP